MVKQTLLFAKSFDSVPAIPTLGDVFVTFCDLKFSTVGFLRYIKIGDPQNCEFQC
jgi:hypothetical protein